MLGNPKNEKFLIIKLVLFFSLTSFLAAKDLPLSFRHLKCARGNLKTCLPENGNKVIPIITKGDPEYGIPNMMPLLIPFIKLIDTPNLILNLSNIQVHGLDKMKILDYSHDEKRNVYTLTLKGQNITIHGDYESEGKILVMPLKGKGRFTMYFKNGVYKSSTFSKIIEKEGDLYFIPVDSRLQTKLEKIEFNFENLFDGDKKLGDQVNAFLNENWEPLVADFGPSIEEVVGSMINQLFVKLAKQVPIKYLYA